MTHIKHVTNARNPVMSFKFKCTHFSCLSNTQIIPSLCSLDLRLDSLLLPFLFSLLSSDPFCTVNSFDGVWKSIYPLTDTHGWEEGLGLNWKPYASQVPYRLIPIPVGSLDSGTWFSLNKIVRRDESMKLWVGEGKERERMMMTASREEMRLEEESDEFSNRITTGLIIMPYIISERRFGGENFTSLLHTCGICVVRLAGEETVCEGRGREWEVRLLIIREV